MITSSSNTRVKQVVQWQNQAGKRRKDGVFLVEGIKMFEEAPKEQLREVYLSQGMEEKIFSKAGNAEFATLKEKLQQTGYETVADDLFQKMSDTKTPQGILSVLSQPSYALEALLSRPNQLLLLLEDIQDPGNLGTILRTGEGAGITGVIMSAGTVDIFNPKTVRATMGSIYRVPFVYVESLTGVMDKIKEAGVHTYAAHLAGKNYYQQLSFQEPTAFLIGNEGRGLKDETAALAHQYVKIPMEGKVESLNASIAASLLMYEAYRQRNS